MDYESEVGQFVPIECDYPGSVIGFQQRLSTDSYNIEFGNYAGEIDINSHIPVNEDYEPDINGDILADREHTQNAFAFDYTATDPFDAPIFEYRADDEN